MRVVYPLLLIALLLAGACSYIFPPRKVECCESKAQCCFEQMCCLPRYALAAGKEPKPFTTNIPSYGLAREEDLQPPPGAVIIKKGWLAKWNPFGSAEEERKPREQPQDQQASVDKQDQQASANKEDRGFWGRLWPF